MFSGLHLIPAGTTVQFMRMRVFTFVVSGILSLVSIAGLFWPGLNFGIDFRGGILIEARATQGAADLGALRNQIGGLHLGEVALQDFGSDRDVLIRVESQGNDRGNNAAVQAIRQSLGTGYEVRRVEVVGPRVGAELIQAGFIASILALVGIAIYVWFRFEWQFALATLVATLHDLVTTLGVFAFTGIDFNLATVAAILTIAGYSVNDTVVVFDRVRENLRKYKSLRLGELLDRSINDTLSRTVITSITTFVAVLALVVVGGEVIRSFTVAMLWGILIGTYSSIYLAAPLLIYMKPVRRADEAKPETQEQAARP